MTITNVFSNLFSRTTIRPAVPVQTYVRVFFNPRPWINIQENFQKTENTIGLADELTADYFKKSFILDTEGGEWRVATVIQKKPINFIGISFKTWRRAWHIQIEWHKVQQLSLGNAKTTFLSLIQQNPENYEYGAGVEEMVRAITLARDFTQLFEFLRGDIPSFDYPDEL